MNIDKTNTIDNTSVIVIHAYVLCNRDCQSSMIVLSKFECNNTILDYLTCVIMSALFVNCRFDSIAIASKLLCFGANGMVAFQGYKSCRLKRNLRCTQMGKIVVCTSFS